MSEKEVGIAYNDQETVLLHAREKWISGYCDEAQEILMELLRKSQSQNLRIRARNELGRAALELGDTSGALKHHQLAYDLAEDLSNVEQKAWALSGLARVFFRQGDLEKTLKLATDAFDLFQTVEDVDLGIYEVKNSLALHDLITGDIERSLATFEDIVKVLESKDNLSNFGKIALIQAYLGLSNIYASDGDYKKSLQQCRDCYELATSLTSQGYRRVMALCNNNIGEAYRLQGDYKKALDHYNQALKINEELNLEHDNATLFLNLGLVYSIRGEFSLASESFKKSIDLVRRTGQDNDLAVTLGDMAAFEHLRGNFKNAKQLFEESVALYQKVGSEEELVEKLCRFSGTLVELGELEKAKKLVLDAKQLADKHQSRYELAFCHYQRGVLEEMQENFGIAKELFSDALKEADSIGMFSLSIDSCLNLAQLAMRKYRLTLDLKSFQIAMDFVERAKKLAERESLYPIVVDTKIILSALYLAKLDYSKSLEAIDEAIYLSEENNLNLHIKRALTQKTALEERKRSLNTEIIQPESARDFAAETAQRYMMLAVRRTRTPEMPDLDPQQLFITVIEYGEFGPNVLISQALPFSGIEQEELFLKMGIFYSAGIAQGNLQHEGLYGPLPLTAQYSALIFATSIPDQKRSTSASNGMCYTLSCLGYPSTFEPYFINREDLERAFKNNLDDLDDISLINEDVLNRILNDVMKNSLIS